MLTYIVVKEPYYINCCLLYKALILDVGNIDCSHIGQKLALRSEMVRVINIIYVPLMLQYRHNINATSNITHIVAINSTQLITVTIICQNNGRPRSTTMP
jgi:hypothetical protein